MDIIISGKGSGKTTRLIKMADKYNGLIVCINRKDAGRIAEMAIRLGYTINLPITFDEFLSHQYYSQGVKRFFIDNADMLIQHMTNVAVEAITITQEEETWMKHQLNNHQNR